MNDKILALDVPNPKWEVFQLKHGRGSIYEIKNLYLRITLLNGHIYYPESWVVSCAALGLENKIVGPLSLTPEEAQDAAMRIIWDNITSKLDSLYEQD
jgi:hypothetical protein